jgi:hypothetical protein
MPRDRSVQINMPDHVAMYNNVIQPVAAPAPVAPAPQAIVAAANGPMAGYAQASVQPQPAAGGFVPASQLPPGAVQPNPIQF